MLWLMENFFDQPVKNKLRTHKNIRKFATGQGDNYTTDCLLDYPYFKEISWNNQSNSWFGPSVGLFVITFDWVI